MIEIVDIQVPTTLEDYNPWVQLAAVVTDLKRQAATLLPRLEGRKVWMVNSTAAGGGVAEMLPTMISLMRELGLEIARAVRESQLPYARLAAELTG